MKKRIGLVSNSSSSSFVAAIRKETYDRVVPTLPEEEQKILNDTTRDNVFLGIPVKVFHDLTLDGGYFITDNDDLFGMDGRDRLYSALDKLLDLACDDAWTSSQED